MSKMQGRKGIVRKNENDFIENVGLISYISNPSVIPLRRAVVSLTKI